MRTLIQIVTAVCDEIGLPRPASVISSPDGTSRQLLALANREGAELAARDYGQQGWPILRKEHTFQVQSTGLIPDCSYVEGSNLITIGTPPTQAPVAGWVLSVSGGSNATAFPYPTYIESVAGSIITVSNVATSTNSNLSMAFGQESYDMPSDFSYIINQTEWDRNYRWQMLGPVSPQEWQVLKSGLSPTGPRRRFRIMEGKFYIDPIPYDSNTLVYEYYSNAWCMSSTGTPQTQWMADTDVPILPDDLFILGLKWRFLRAKVFDYTQEYSEYEARVQSLMARAAAGRILPLNATPGDVVLLGNQNIPDTGFGTV